MSGSRFQFATLPDETVLRVARHGRQGAALLYFPTSAGDCDEFARYGMIEDARPWIDGGKVQIFAVDGYNLQSLYNDLLHPLDRIRGYARYESAVCAKLLPLLRTLAPQAEIGALGCSYGAFVAANLLFKCPDRVRVAGGLSGVYKMDHRLDGYHDDTVYFHTPLEYLARLDDALLVSQIHGTRGFAVYGGESDAWLSHSHEFDHLLRERGFPVHTEIWRAPADHHEHWWKQQLRRFLAWAYGEPG